MFRSKILSKAVGCPVALCVLLVTACWTTVILAQGPPAFPGGAWERVASPQALGWSLEKLKPARDYSATIDTAAVMVVVNGKVLDEWGETATKYNVHSIRKSLLSAMYGIHVRQGHIDLEKTMQQLGIDDNEPSLDATEKKATVHDLLKARSGVYHPALYETAAMKAARPARHSHEPGTFWYYNNWDFNALGIIFERSVKNSLFREFKARIADPVGMQDFTIDDTEYVTGPDSVYAAYPFRMTARDMARFGLLFLRQGNWRGTQVVPKDWVVESTTSYSDAGNSGGYGYLWWVAANGKHFPGVTVPDGSYSARGAGGHYILVVPAYDLVVVHRVNTDIRGRQVSAAEFGQLLKLILEARTGR
jgi:CubicO group peptidase (beta-lactamase class C family)